MCTKINILYFLPLCINHVILCRDDRRTRLVFFASYKVSNLDRKSEGLAELLLLKWNSRVYHSLAAVGWERKCTTLLPQYQMDLGGICHKFSDVFRRLHPKFIGSWWRMPHFENGFKPPQREVLQFKQWDETGIQCDFDELCKWLSLVCHSQLNVKHYMTRVNLDCMFLISVFTLTTSMSKHE